MATSPIYGWSEPNDSDLVTNGALAIRTLGNAIDTTMATMVPKSTYTAKGSIAGATAASTPANLAVGTNTQVLTADSSAATGLAWALRGGMTLLSTTTLSGTSTTISSISTSYQHLRIIVRNVVASGNDNYQIRLNGDTGGNYQYYAIQTAGTVATGENGSGTSNLPMGFVSASTAAGDKSSIIMDIPRYNDTSNCSGFSVSSQIGYGTPRMFQNFFRYNNSAGITSITFFTTGTTFSSGTVYIYGVN